MLNDSLFSDAGWLFFVVWSIVVGIFSVAAFGGDLRAKTPVISHSPGSSSNKTTPHRSREL